MRLLLFLFFVGTSIFGESVQVSLCPEDLSPPRIVEQPPNTELIYPIYEKSIENHKSIKIKCKAVVDTELEIKNTTLSYRWTKNGKTFVWDDQMDRITQQPGQGTIIIYKPEEVDSGRYQCFAENKCGVATSNAVNVRIFKPQPIEEEKLKTTAIDGEPFRLECKPPNEWVKPTVFWMKLKETEKNISTVKIDEFKKLKRLGIGNEDVDNFISDRNGNLHFINVKQTHASNGFDYVCVLTSEYVNTYQILKRVHLKVINANSEMIQTTQLPTLIYHNNELEEAFLGELVPFICIFNEKPTTEMAWEQHGPEIRSIHYGVGMAYFELVKSGDSGNVTCEASYSNNVTLAHSFQLIVNVPPHFTVKPTVQSSVEGDTVKFWCKADGFPKVDITWTHNGNPIDKTLLTVDSNKLVIENITRNDIGNYGCNASNSFGYIYADVYLNIVKGSPPEFIETPQNVIDFEGNSVILRCSVYGTPTPTIRWIRHGHYHKEHRAKLYPNGDLVFEKVDLDDAGVYTCHAHNEWGDIQAKIVLIVKSQIVRDDEFWSYHAGESVDIICRVDTSSLTEFTIKWKKDFDEIDFNKKPRYNQSNDYSFTILNTIPEDAGEYTCEISTDFHEYYGSNKLTVENYCNTTIDTTNATVTYIMPFNDTWDTYNDNTSLVPGIGYNFNIKRKTDNGSIITENVSCSTFSDYPLKNPVNVTCDVLRNTILSISWTPMEPIDFNGPGFYYRIYYKQEGKEQEDEWTPIGITYSNDGHYAIVVEDGFDHRIKVIAGNEVGEFSNDVPSVTCNNNDKPKE